ncbi:MAG: hypothetical protein ACFB9M_13300 [Myxococcota bacterium]
MILFLFGGLVLVVILGAALIHESRPSGQAGPEADALARRMEAAVRLSDWEKVGYIEWTFADRNRHAWDRVRGLARVTWKDREIFIRLDTHQARTFRAGQEVLGKASDELSEEAIRRFTNDSFWLNPVAKLFEPGTTRAIVPDSDGQPTLLITYTEGGVTPGDAYQWFLGPDDLPQKWRMWASILPLGGIPATWDDYLRLETGALIATRHVIGPFSLDLTNIKAARSWETIHPKDPFERIR